MKLPARDGVYPESVAIRYRNLRWRTDHNERFRFYSRQQFPDVDVGVALRPDVIAVIGNAPIVAPQGLRLGDRQCPQLGPLSGSQFRKRVHSFLMGTRDRKHTIGLARIDVLDEEDEFSPGLALHFGAQTALAIFQGLGTLGITVARGIGERNAREQNRRNKPRKSHFPQLY